MKIAILSNGTRGDVEPLLSLGAALSGMDHEVTVAASSNFKPLVERYGLIYQTIPVNLQDYLRTSEGQVWMKRISGNPITLFTEIRRVASEVSGDTLNAYWKASRNADILITTTGALGDVHIKYELAIPMIEIQFQPLFPTGNFSYPLLRTVHGPRFIKKASFLLVDKILWMVFRKELVKWQESCFSRIRKFKGGPFSEKRKASDLILGAYSRQLVKKPDDWPDRVKITGFLLTPPDESFTPSLELERFIEQGSAPFYIGFGSMAVQNPAKFISLIEKLLFTTDLRLIFSPGWSEIKIPFKTRKLHVIDFVPHNWLFPLTAGVIHHGGAGTTAAALAAGIPQMIVPFTADQPFWAARTSDLGVAPVPCSLKKMSQKRFLDGINFMQSPAVKSKAAAISDKLKKENGLRSAIDEILKYGY